MLDYFFGGAVGHNIFLAFKYLYLFLPLWLPVVLGIALFHKWVDYIREKYWHSMGIVILEVKLPKEIFKSPKAMELVLGALHQTADEGNWYQKYWLGQTRSWFSLELISEGGHIRFFIWMRAKYKNSVEGHLYSQYPGVEVQEVEDYTKNFYFDADKHKLFGCQWKLSKPDAYPIKTYIDYGLDKDPKEEFKVDPFATNLEFLSTVTHGHTFWMQIIIRAHKKEQHKKGTWFEQTDAWKDEAEAEIKKIIEKFRPEDKEKQTRMPTEGEKDTISSLERSISKFPFDATIRSIYFSPKDIFNGMYVAGIFGYFKQYASPDLNGFGASGWLAEFGDPLKDWWKNKDMLPAMLIDEYKMRRFFFSPYKGKWFYSKPFVLNTEELATIYHFPGSIAAAPTFERVPSKKSEAPSNLPV